MNAADILWHISWTMVIVSGVLIIAGLLARYSEGISAWLRTRRRLKRLRSRQPDESRFVNSVLTKDWRDIERAEKGLRRAA